MIVVALRGVAGAAGSSPNVEDASRLSASLVVPDMGVDVLLLLLWCHIHF